MEKHVNESEKYNNCPYYHNDYEYGFHQLIYKTKYCRNDNCQNNKCIYAHSIKRDLRSIYAVSKIEINNIIRVFQINDLFYSNEIMFCKVDFVPSEFNLKTYKTLECPYGEKCLLDMKLCFNYHNYIDRRRPDYEKITSKICDYAFEEGLFINPENCPRGDKCENIHSVAEFCYYPKHFKRQFCKDEKDQVCKYKKVCPYRHRSNNDKSNNYELYQDSLKLLMDELDEKINSLEKILNSSEKKLRPHSCMKCFNLIDDNYNVLAKCKHFFCEQCLDEQVSLLNDVLVKVRYENMFRVPKRNKK